MDDGSVQVFTGYRVQHNLGRGPAKGGIRYHQDVTPRRGQGPGDVDDLEVRGRRASRTAAARAASSSIPKKLSQKELEGLTRRFITEIEVLIGPEKDIPAPDVNTNAQIMAWMMDTYSMHAGLHGPGRRHRQADQPRRLGGPQRGDRPRLRLHASSRRRATSAWT